MIYFIADTHFCHKNVITMENRPFSNVKDMDAALIDNWNKVVHKNDDVYFLGDFAFAGKSHSLEIFTQLKGKKYLIKGNHDPHNLPYEWVKDYYELHYNRIKYVLCHYPIHSWNGRYRGSIHIHGHSHRPVDLSVKELLPEQNRFLCVSVECINYTPISIEQVNKIFNI